VLVRESFQAHSRLESWLLALSVIGLAPLMEELFFRGFLPWAWLNRFGSRGMLVGPALLFALLHLDLWHLPDLFLLGLGLGVLRHRLGQSGAGHRVACLQQPALACPVEQRRSTLEQFLDGSGIGPPWQALVCALPGGLWLLMLGMRRRPDPV
jgi:hypothetical protein